MSGANSINPIVSRHGHRLLLAGILLLALGLRLWGLGFGLPNLYHPDEDALVMPAIEMIRTGNLEPARLEYGSLQIYTLAAVAAAVFIWLARQGVVAEVGQLPQFQRGDYPLIYPQPEFFLAARLVSALMGTAIVLLTYLLARRLGNGRLALLSAALAAVLPALVTHAHFATPDTPLTFYTLLALYLLVRVYDNWDGDRGWAYIGAGFACGLAASTKYNGIVLALPLLLVPLLRVRQLDDLLRFRVLAGPLAMAAGFVAGTPYAVLNPPHFLFWIGYALRLYNAPNYDPVGTSWQWHLEYHLTSPNAPVFLLGLVGFGVSFRRWGRRSLLVNGLALLLWLAIVTQTRREARMWLPTAPLFAIWTGLALEWAAGWLGERPFLRPWPSRRRALALAAGPLLLIAILLVSSARINGRFLAEDVRTQAQHWIEAHVPPGTAIAIDYFAPNLDPAVWPIIPAAPVYRKDLAWFEAQGATYLVLSEAGNNLSRLSIADQAGWRALTEGACLIQTFSGPFLSAERREMWLYRLPPCDPGE